MMVRIEQKHRDTIQGEDFIERDREREEGVWLTFMEGGGAVRTFCFFSLTTP